MSIVTESWVDKAGDNKNNKKKILSVRIAMTAVFAVAWLIPIVFLSFFIFNNYQKAYVEKTEKLMQNQVDLSCTLLTADIDAAIAKVLKPTYEGEWESLYNKYSNGQIERADFLVAIKSSLISKYYMDEQFSRYAFYLTDSDSPWCYSGKNGYGYEAFLRYVQPLVFDIRNKDSNYIELVIADNQIYLIRNLYTVNEYRKFATLVVGLDKNVLLSKLPMDDINAFFLTSDDSILTLSNTSMDDFFNEDCFHFVGDYSCDNYEITLHYYKDKGELYSDVNALNKVVNIILFAMLPLIILSYIFLTHQIERPLIALTKASRKITDGEFGTTVGISMPNKEFEGLADSFNTMSLEIKRLIDTVYLEQIATKDALIDSLQAQINPHFLNNTLEMMNWQARMNNDTETSKMIEALGTVLDYSTNRNHNRLIRLADEIQCGDAFLYIMSMRFGKRLNVEKKISEDLLNLMVPSLVLQPLLENAIKHGVEMISQGTIWLNVYEDGANLHIDVINTGKEISEEKMDHIRDIIDGKYRLEKAEPGVHTSIGIYNVNKRIRLIFGDQYGLSVSLTKEGHFMSSILIPLTGEER